MLHLENTGNLRTSKIISSQLNFAVRKKKEARAVVELGFTANLSAVLTFCPKSIRTLTNFLGQKKLAKPPFI